MIIALLILDIICLIGCSFLAFTETKNLIKNWKTEGFDKVTHTCFTIIMYITIVMFIRWVYILIGRLS